jgi:NAD(P)H-nitrite reductase large subunit
MEHVVIIGNGIAGVTTARTIRKNSNHRITIVSAESKWHISRPALMYVAMGHLELEQLYPYEHSFWPKNRIDLVHDSVVAIDTTNKIVTLAHGAPIPYTKLVLATGSVPNMFSWPGQHLDGVQGLYSLQHLQQFELATKEIRHAVVVGGGLIGIEVAEMLHSKGIACTLLVRESGYWNNVLPLEESECISRHIGQQHINLLLSTTLDSIQGDSQQRVCGITTTDGRNLPCQAVFLTVGVRPNISVVRDTEIEVKRGILVNDFFETSAADVYAVGDCAELPGGKLEQLWYTGRFHGEFLGATISGNRQPYTRDIFFNSAKFFDVEYQTYGVVPATCSSENSYVWQHKTKPMLLRIVHQNNVAIGINVLGIRLRQLTCQEWIRKGASVSHVLSELHRADFDPEFSGIIKQVQKEMSVS